MRTIEFADKLGSEYWLGTDGQYPVVKGSPEEFNNYACYISELTCQSAKIKTNINAVLGPSVKSWGILTTKDDGKESYMRCISEDYSALLTDLSPNRTYKVRWYAQDINGIEYYSMPTYFITYPINPITLTASDITTSSCKLEANYFYEGKSNCGFYVEQEDEENGFYIWDVEMEGEKYTCQVNNLKGNTAYEFFAVCQIDGINYDGNQLPFKTASIYTLSPSEFTDDSAQINGEVGIDSNNVYFEYRSSSTPSVIESSEIIATIKDSRASATLTNLILDETYKYRIAAISGDTKLFGNWVEFKFKGTAGISDCYTDKDYDLEIYNLNGVRIDGDINSLSSGIYIIKQGNTSHKILIQ